MFPRLQPFQVDSVPCLYLRRLRAEWLIIFHLILFICPQLKRLHCLKHSSGQITEITRYCSTLHNGKVLGSMITVYGNEGSRPYTKKYGVSLMEPLYAVLSASSAIGNISSHSFGLSATKYFKIFVTALLWDSTKPLAEGQ